MIASNSSAETAHQASELAFSASLLWTLDHPWVSGERAGGAVRGVSWELTLFVHHVNCSHSWVQASTFITDRNDEAVGP